MILLKKEYLEKRFKFPLAIILSEKHETRVFDASDLETLYKSCLTIVKERLKDGVLACDTKMPNNKPDFDRETIKKLPKCLQEDALKKLDSYDQELEASKEASELLQLAKRAVKERSGYLAYQILEARKEWEYEGFKLVSLENCDH